MASVVLRLGNDISTDIVYPGRYMATVLPTETPQYAFADHARFNEQLRKGEIPAGGIIVGGRNFGCGSSREQAASCLRGHELVVVARHFGRIFLQNAINVGLRLVICPLIDADEGDEFSLGPDAVKNVTQGLAFDVEPMPPACQAIIDAGGLIPYTRKLLVRGA